MAVATPATARSGRARLAWLLAASYGLRVWLAVSGGQAYWPDEARYMLSREAAYELGHGHWRLAFEALLGGADHVFFRWVGLPVAVAEHALGGDHPALAACYFGLFSAGTIYLVWAVALRAGAGSSEALWAAFLAAASNSLFYYSRHYLPYDVALFGMLLALWLAVGPWSPRRALLAGVAAGFGFLTYNGYWLLGACVLSLYALFGAGGPGRMAARAGLAFAGLVLPIALFLALGAAASHSVLRSYLVFAQTVKQGDFHVGFRVVPEYLWRAEGPFLGVLLAGFGYALASERGDGGLRRLRLWGASLAFLYGGLVFFSDMVPTFMVYGRMSRCLVPFLCLGAGAGVAGFLSRRGASRPAWTVAVAVLAVALAAANFAAPLRQVFPARFLQILKRRLSEIPPGRFYFLRAANAETQWGGAMDGAAARPGEDLLLRCPNPLQFRPYQFEGFTQAQRRQLNGNDIAMQVFGLPLRKAGPAGWDGYPGPVSMTVRFPGGREPFAEPLLCSGRAGAGDVVFVRYLDSRHVAFGMDHWGAMPDESAPVEVDFARAHEIVITSGALLPAAGNPTYAGDPALEGLRGHFLVRMDGRTVLSRHTDCYPSPRESIHFGANLIGGSSTEPYFSGAATAFSQAPLDEVARSVPELAGGQIARDRSPEWGGALGPVRVRFVLPPPAPGPSEGQPLLSVAGPRLRQVLYAVRDGDRVRLAIDTMGTGGTWSEPMALSPSGTQEVDISLGALLPAAGAPIYGGAPSFAAMRVTNYVSLNHRRALFTQAPAAGGEPCSAVFAANVLGSTACVPFFKGEMVSIQPLELRDIPAGSLASAEFMAHLGRPGWNGFTGALRLELSFGPGRPGEGQPILSSGATGRGDIVFVRYETLGRAEICVDHWGAPLLISEPFSLVPGAPHALTLSLGSLYPPADTPLPAADAGADALRNRVRIELDGRRIMDRAGGSFPSDPESTTIGANFLGGSTAGSTFLGEILHVGWADLGALER